MPPSRGKTLNTPKRTARSGAPSYIPVQCGFLSILRMAQSYCNPEQLISPSSMGTEKQYFVVSF